MAIYQKARPVTWTEVVGQEHVRDVLMGALEKGRIGHAYLFSGPRGVGKTTTARLIAMTVNCESDSRPCGECQSCRLVKTGAHPDVVEIDAASNNSVDDVRDLREKVGLASMRGGKKVYILDEAHMMSRGAFNALLKTLEEPPEHVIFILATTEPEKILPTILSRCQHYRFRRLSEQEIGGKLQRLCEQEGVSYEMDALLLMGRLADGAMRDGESLLERMLSSGEPVTLRAVEMALGLPPGERMLGLARSLLLADAETVLRLAGELYREGFAARTVVEQTKVSVRNLLHAQLGLSGGSNDQLDVGQALRLLAALDEQDQRFSRQADLLALEMALTHAMLSTENAPGHAGGGGATQVPPDLLRRLQGLEQTVQQLRQGRPVAGAPQPVSDNQTVPANRTPAKVPAAQHTPPPAHGTWHDVLRLADIKMRAFLKPAQATFEGGSLIISISSKFHGAQVISKFDELTELVTKVFGDIPFEVVTPDSSKKKSGSAGVRAQPVQPQAEAQPVAQVLQQAPEVRSIAGARTAQTPVPAEAAPAQQIPPAPWEASAPPASPPARTEPLGRTTQKARGFFEDGPAKKPEPVAAAPVSPAAPPVSTPPAAPRQGTPADLAPLPSEHEVLDRAPVFDDLPFPDEDFGAQEAPQKPRKSGGAFQHPLYDTLQQLFPHRIREVGVLKAKVVEDDSEASEAEPAEE